MSVCVGRNGSCVKSGGSPLCFQQLPALKSIILGLFRKPVYCKTKLNGSSKSPVSRQPETTQNRAGAGNHRERKGTASELNYISQPISSPRHCTLFRVKVKTKKKMGTNHKKSLIMKMEHTHL